MIGSFEVIERGSNYITPTVLINNLPVGSATVKGGQITRVSTAAAINYDDDVNVEVTSGKGATFFQDIDQFGRIKNISVRNGGFYYKDVPAVVAIDPTGKGKGALLKASISNGKITDIRVLAEGIDYDSKATYISVQPVGSGAVVKANVQYYEVNRPEQIKNMVCNGDYVWKFDEGNGFLYEKPGFEGPISEDSKTTFGYTVLPTNLVPEITDIDDPVAHSPLIGWAFDGNPIYGPFGYANKKDETGGYVRQQSAYRLINSRQTIIPAKSRTVGSNPPLESEYPLGYFVQDWVYDPGSVGGVNPFRNPRS